MLLIREQDVLDLMTMAEAIRLVRESFIDLDRGVAQNQARRRLFLPSGAVLHSLAGAWGGYFGTKIYSTHPQHGMHFLVVLYDAETARPLALFEANHLGQIRTGAASGVATDALAARDAETLAIIGAGFQAKAQVDAVIAVRPIRQVRIWSRTQEKRQRFAEQIAARHNVIVHCAASAREAVEGAAILVTATWAKEPVFEADWVAPGTHINAMGSNNPQRRELPREILERAGLIVVDSLEQARIESGDLLLAWNPGEWESRGVRELGDVLRNPPTLAPAAIRIFKSNGLGVQDVAVAAKVYEHAVAEGRGERIELLYS